MYFSNYFGMPIVELMMALAVIVISLLSLVTALHLLKMCLVRVSSSFFNYPLLISFLNN